MATTFVTAPERAIASPRVAPARAQIGGGVTTYYYRASNGSRGSTTDLGAIPAGAVIERTVTT
jgi:hypothetical protein